ncbi:lipid-A-disaccharide synthase, partial [bacterium]|nr:lipid-A-disaccharide synthase [bacterium]
IGPQVWAWRPKRVYKMGRIVDHIAVIMPFEKALYDDANVPVTFTGHPLTDEVVRDKTKQQAREQLQIDDKTTVGLFPGSRGGEIAHILPILLESAKLIREQQSQINKTEVQFILPVANTIKPEDLEPFSTIMEDLRVITIKDRFYDVAQSCDVILTASGTATLEIGLLEIPMVIVYKTSAITFFIGKRLVSLNHIGLVNIIPGKEIVREFLQGDARPQSIAEEALHLLNDPEYYESMRHQLSLLRQQLGDGNGSKNVAELAWKMLNNQL